MSSVMLLNHIHEEAIAKKIKVAYDGHLAGRETPDRDLGGTAGDLGFTDALIARLK